MQPLLQDVHHLPTQVEEQQGQGPAGHVSCQASGGMSCQVLRVTEMVPSRFVPSLDSCLLHGAHVLPLTSAASIRAARRPPGLQGAPPPPRQHGSALAVTVRHPALQSSSPAVYLPQHSSAQHLPRTRLGRLRQCLVVGGRPLPRQRPAVALPPIYELSMNESGAFPSFRSCTYSVLTGVRIIHKAKLTCCSD